MTRVIAACVAIACLLTPVGQSGDCKCHTPKSDDQTRWGGNQAIVLQPKQHFREIKGVVEVSERELVENALVEVFDKPEYLVSDRPRDAKPQQKRLRACVTPADGTFCFKDLPDGRYELRISRDQGFDVTHVYIVVDRNAGTTKPLHVGCT
jgi:hypothetical protein